jgi:hypothetical protein
MLFLIWVPPFRHVLWRLIYRLVTPNSHFKPDRKILPVPPVMTCARSPVPSPLSLPRRRVGRGLVIGCLLAIMIIGDAGSAWAFGRTLDQIFRGTVRGENEGELPAYVINRGPPPYPEPKPPNPDEQAAMQKTNRVGAVEQPLTQDMPWEEVVKDVAGGSPGPFAVETVRRRAERADGQAVELLAWMSANGVGVQRDLPQAFDLYARAEQLGVQSAQDNAKAIYRAMTTEQRRTVFNPY